MVNVTAPNLTTDITRETAEQLNQRYSEALIPLSVLFGILGLCGAIGNTIVLVVFSLSREYNFGNFRIFVIFLGFVDLVTCLTIIPAQIAKHTYMLVFPSQYLCKITCFFNTFGTCVSAFTLLIVSVDRFRRVCQPLRRQISTNLAVKLLGGVLVLSFLLTIPAPFMCGLEDSAKVNLYGTSTAVTVCAVEKEFISSFWRYFYKVGMTVLLLLVSAALISMYALIGRTVFRHWNKRASGPTIRLGSTKLLKQKSKEIPLIQLNSVAMASASAPAIADNNNTSPDGITKECSLTNQGCQHQEVPPTHELTNTCSQGSKADLLEKNSQQQNGVTCSSWKYRLRKGDFLGDIAFNEDKNVWTIQFKSGYNKVVRSCASSSTSVASGKTEKKPYKTLIWFILTLIFIITYFLYAILSFLSLDVYRFSQNQFLAYSFFYRLYFINNVINPIVYVSLDNRFKISCKRVFGRIKRVFS